MVNVHVSLMVGHEEESLAQWCEQPFLVFGVDVCCAFDGASVTQTDAPVPFCPLWLKKKTVVGKGGKAPKNKTQTRTIQKSTTKQQKLVGNSRCDWIKWLKEILLSWPVPTSLWRRAWRKCCEVSLPCLFVLTCSINNL